MSWGFCYIAERGELAAVVRQTVERFAAVGILLRNPETKRVTMLTDEGEQQEIADPERFIVAAERPVLTLQFWFSADADLVCTFRRLKVGVVRHTYSVQGFTTSERVKTIQWAIDYFHMGVAAQTAMWLIVDPDGETEDTDWDRVVLGENATPLRLPRVIGLPSDKVSGLVIPPGWLTIPLNHSALICAPGAFQPPTDSRGGSRS